MRGKFGVQVKGSGEMMVDELAVNFPLREYSGKNEYDFAKNSRVSSLVYGIPLERAKVKKNERYIPIMITSPILGVAFMRTRNEINSQPRPTRVANPVSKEISGNPRETGFLLAFIQIPNILRSRQRPYI